MFKLFSINRAKITNFLCCIFLWVQLQWLKKLLSHDNCRSFLKSMWFLFDNVINFLKRVLQFVNTLIYFQFIFLKGKLQFSVLVICHLATTRITPINFLRDLLSLSTEKSFSNHNLHSEELLCQKNATGTFLKYPVNNSP